jgi:cytochrome P450
MPRIRDGRAGKRSEDLKFRCFLGAVGAIIPTVLFAMRPTSTTLEGKTRPLVRVGGLPRVDGGGTFGPVAELLRDQFGALRRWQRDYGGVFELRLGPASFVIAADANTASEMLIEGGNSFVRGGTLYTPMYPLLGDNSMLTSEGEVWRARRRGAQPQLRQRAVAAMGDRIDGKLIEVLGEIGPGAHDIYEFSGRLSMSVALAVMFGHELSRSSFEALGTAIDYALGRIGLGWVANQLPRWVPIPGRRKLRRSLGVIDRVIYELIDSRRASGEFGDDLLGVLMHMAENDAMTRTDVRNEAVSLVAAGYETTANAIAWALYELARTPEMFARVRAEVDAALEAGVPRNPKSLAYTRQVFMESMRMYPSTIWLPRNATEDATLAGYSIPNGTAVLCSTYLVHHDPHAWDEPERFDPERFAEDSSQPRSRHAFMPFGLGQHMCIGQHLAMMEGPLAIARIVQRWDLAAIPGRDAEPKISTTMGAKDGIWLQVSARA